MSVLEVDGIYKKIGRREIIKGISFSVEAGEIFGFLGPNGAGKTTTIRMIVGLIKPTKGSIKIMGHEIRKEKVKALENLGCIVENPDMYDDLTGIRNLNIYADLYGDISQERIQEVIELVDLKDRINDKVKRYSLGMKQRLGLAQAILSKPKLLILDEPTNGLDPIGIHDFREIIRKIAKEENSSVFISSHNLAEIEQICDRFALINNGIIQTVENVNSCSASIETVEIKTEQLESLEKLVKNLNFISGFEILENKALMKINKGDFSKLIKVVGKSDIDIEDIYKVKESLEDKFMKMMSISTKKGA